MRKSAAGANVRAVSLHPGDAVAMALNCGDRGGIDLRGVAVNATTVEINGLAVPRSSEGELGDLISPAVAAHLRRVTVGCERPELVGYGSFKLVYAIGDGRVARIYRRTHNDAERLGNRCHIAVPELHPILGADVVDGVRVEYQHHVTPATATDAGVLKARLAERGLAWIDSGKSNAGVTADGSIVIIDGYVARRELGDDVVVYAVSDRDGTRLGLVAATSGADGARAYFDFNIATLRWSHASDAAALFTSPTAQQREVPVPYRFTGDVRTPAIGRLIYQRAQPDVDPDWPQRRAEIPVRAELLALMTPGAVPIRVRVLE